ncbi:MAG TPA: flagellar hook capping FlgD N-terminal domain-containing protein [Melioribacteraceae bacterium]|nr:flagellar hook capping FlgD N-terminal domain-containing protein [Melioribacteraceae bacterium]
MSSGVTNINFGTNSTNSATSTKGKSELGKDDFLKLMITQLKNQDPTEPLDSSAYASQLAQFSSLEQLTNINTSLNSSLDANYLLTQSINNTMSASWIGKDAKLDGNVLSNNGQEKISLGYNLPAEASNVTIKIYNNSGALVKTLENCEKTAGDHKLSWDFYDNNGVKLSKGDYTFKVEAKTTDGKSMTVESYRIGTIDSIKYTSNGTVLMIGNVGYSLSDIAEILNSTGN